MYIDFEDYRPETPRVEGALSGGTTVLISWTLHVLFVLLLLFGPRYLPQTQRSVGLPVKAQNLEEATRFVFMQPRVDISKQQLKPNVESSDQDRVKSSIDKAPDPKNSLPYIQGNSPERVEADASRPPPEKPQPNPADQPAPQQGRQNQPTEGQVAANDPARSLLRLPDAPSSTPALSLGRTGSGGILSDAIRNLQRYTQNQRFDNPQGSGDGQGLIQFDSKGVDFGPWLRRFVAQVKRNWFIPSAALMMKGHVVVTFNVHRDGSITDIEIKQPSTVDAFDRAAVNALISSNPTQALPPEYPSDRAFFTVTFLYNEMPPE
jgi:TonB family protein